MHETIARKSTERIVETFVQHSKNCQRGGESVMRKYVVCVRYTCIRVHTHAYVCTYMYVHTYIYICIHIYIYIYIHAYMYMHICICIYIYTYIYTYVYVSLHIRVRKYRCISTRNHFRSNHTKEDLKLYGLYWYYKPATEWYKRLHSAVSLAVHMT